MALNHGPTVLIDGMNCFLRSYFRSPYMDAHGQRAGGLAGTVISVRKVVQDVRASNVLVVWDGEGGSQRRKAVYKEYKAGRTVRLNRRDDDMAEDPAEQLENIREQLATSREYLDLLGIPQVRPEGVEADDVIAYLAANVDQPGGTVIVSTDQDLLQLIRGRELPAEYGHCPCDPKTTLGIHSDTREDGTTSDSCVWCGEPKSSEVRVWSPVKKVMYDRSRFISDYGVIPENFRLVKALTGDPSDNIQGVKGFGAKTVARCFPFLSERRVGPDDVLAAAGELKGVLGKRLHEEKSRFLENLTLVDLSAPMLSATAARQAREMLVRDMGCHEVDFRVRIVRDGVSFTGDNFMSPFRDLTTRRRRLLEETRVAEQGDQA